VRVQVPCPVPIIHKTSYEP